jgi:hypothetical protein
MNSKSTSQRREISAKAGPMALLFVVFVTFVFCGCKPGMNQGEITLRAASNETRALTGVEVMGFSKDFGTIFTEWQKKWNAEVKLAEITSQANPSLKKELEKLDGEIKDTHAMTNTLEAKVKQARSNLLESLGYEKERFSAHASTLEVVLMPSLSELKGSAEEELKRIRERINHALNSPRGQDSKLESSLHMKGLREQKRKIDEIEMKIQKWQTNSLTDDMAALHESILEVIRASEKDKKALMEKAKINAQTEITLQCIRSFSTFLAGNVVYSTRTDESGKFQIPENIGFLFAGAVSEKTGETPCWLIKVDSSRKLIRLNESNLAMKGISDGTWMLNHTP